MTCHVTVLLRKPLTNRYLLTVLLHRTPYPIRKRSGGLKHRRLQSLNT